MLRQVTDADLPALFEVFSNAEVARYWSAPPLPDMDAAAELARTIDAGRRSGSLLRWAVTRRGEDRLVGTCTLAAIDRTHRRCEIGYALGFDDPAYFSRFFSKRTGLPPGRLRERLGATHTLSG